MRLRVGALPAVLSFAVVLAACASPEGRASAPGISTSVTRLTPPFVAIDVWPPGPRPLSTFMLSTWVAPFTHGHADFYGWGGSFLRTVDAPGNLMASVDGRYFVNFTTGQLSSSTGQVVRAFTQPTLDQGSTSLNWAADGDYFCGLETSGAGYSLIVADVAGKVQRIRLQLPADLVPPDGLRAMGVKCSLSSSRALVYGGSASRNRVALVSLPDGHALSDIQTTAGYSGGASPDLHWLAINNGVSTEVVNLIDGTLQAQLDGDFASFTPDSAHLVGTDGRGAAAVVDWRTGTASWKGHGHLSEILANSDPSTDMMLLWLSTGQPQAGTDTYDYWIVDGAGSGRRFNPRDCISIEASPARTCSIGG